jgi:hypothetical protein
MTHLLLVLPALLPALVGARPAGATGVEEAALAKGEEVHSSPSPQHDDDNASTADDAPACVDAQPGFLSVATTPWTMVVIDGTRVGTTPLFRHALVPGAHHITFINEAAGVTAQEDVDIGEGELRKLKFIFVSDAETESALDESRADVARSEDDCLATDIDHALLSIDVKPWARVILDGRVIGTTPLFRHAVALGTHRVLLVGPGGERTAARFDAAVDELVKLSLTFQGNESDAASDESDESDETDRSARNDEKTEHEAKMILPLVTTTNTVATPPAVVPDGAR